jgi:hypothetical protein
MLKASFSQPISCPTPVVHYKPKKKTAFGWCPRVPNALKKTKSRAAKQQIISHLRRVLSTIGKPQKMLIRNPRLQHKTKDSFPKGQEVYADLPGTPPLKSLIQREFSKASATVLLLAILFGTRATARGAKSTSL